MQVKDVLDEKKKRGEEVMISIAPDTTIRDAIRILCENRIGAVMAIDAGGRLVGIVSERDILRRCCQTCDDIDRATIDAIMTTDVIVAHPPDSVHHALETMTAKQIKHLPVIEHENVVGIISITDLLRRLYTEDEMKLRYLKDYVEGMRKSNVY